MSSTSNNFVKAFRYSMNGRSKVSIIRRQAAMLNWFDLHKVTIKSSSYGSRPPILPSQNFCLDSGSIQVVSLGHFHHKAADVWISAANGYLVAGSNLLTKSVSYFRSIFRCMLNGCIGKILRRRNSVHARDIAPETNAFSGSRGYP